MTSAREIMKELTFHRDGNKCVVCGAIGIDAHHILERRLWPDGGYYLDNLATVCEEHHLARERTDISVEEIREYAGVKKIVPPHFYDDVIYDKWDSSEGYVVRLADSFPFRDFKKYIGKFVRKGHFQTTKHWMRGQQIITNKLRS